MTGFTMLTVSVGEWTLPVLAAVSGLSPLSLLVRGAIGNSITTSVSGAKRTADWKRSVCTAVHGERGRAPWQSRATFGVTLGFRFAPSLHGGGDLDVENYVKPTVDAIAAGLFLPSDGDPCAVGRYAYDDSGFRHMLIHRLPDAERESDEGVAIHVACYRT